jgi:hypothetical protein
MGHGHRRASLDDGESHARQPVLHLGSQKGVRPLQEIFKGGVGIVDKVILGDSDACNRTTLGYHRHDLFPPESSKMAQREQRFAKGTGVLLCYDVGL